MAATATAPKVSNNQGEQKNFENQPSVKFWHPSKAGTGSAAIFEFSSEKKCIFLSMIPQVAGEENRFNPDEKTTCKLGLNDLGEMISCLAGRIEGCGGKKKDAKYFSGIYHNSPAGSSIVGLSYMPPEGDYAPGFMLSLSVDRNGQKSKHQVKLTMSEAMQTEIFLRRFMVEMF